jgi:hypothetical protein
MEDLARSKSWNMEDLTPSGLRYTFRGRFADAAPKRLRRRMRVRYSSWFRPELSCSSDSARR